MSDPLPHPTATDLRPPPPPGDRLQRRHIIGLVAFGVGLLALLAVITGVQIANSGGVKPPDAVKALWDGLDRAERTQVCDGVATVSDEMLLILIDHRLDEAGYPDGVIEPAAFASFLREVCS